MQPFFCTFSTSDAGVADAAINDSVSVINHRAIFNDVDGLVMMSLLQSQMGSLFVAFLFCLFLLWLQFPVFHISVPYGLSLWPPVSSYFASQHVYPSEIKGFSIFEFYDFFRRSSSGSSSNLDRTGSIYLSAVVVATILLCVLAIFFLRIALSFLYKFYSRGADPLGIKSDKRIKPSSQSSQNTVSAYEDSSADVDSYTSPSSVVLNSIQRFNAASACSGDANSAAEHAK
jgi:hypothetical protein